MNPISLFNGLLEAEVVSSGMPVLMIGIQDAADTSFVLAIDENGAFTWVDLTNLRLPWRYDFGRGDWVDIKETDDTQDNSPDGGPGIPGSVPELDEFGEGDPFDQEGRQATGGVGDVDAGEDR